MHKIFNSQTEKRMKCNNIKCIEVHPHVREQTESHLTVVNHVDSMKSLEHVFYANNKQRHP